MDYKDIDFEKIENVLVKDLNKYCRLSPKIKEEIVKNIIREVDDQVYEVLKNCINRYEAIIQSLKKR